MIQVSSLWGQVRQRMLGRFGVNRIDRHGFLVWHAVCITIGLSGCPYLGPINYVPEVNSPPDITAWTPEGQFCEAGWEDLVDDPTDEDLHPLCIPPDLATLTVFVNVYNPDGDMLDYSWYTDFKGEILSGELSGYNNFVDCEELVPGAIDNGDVLWFSVADRSNNVALHWWTLVVF